jgi:8-hydroxy-5-deazaflavin:NADPH oxidoreductase
MKIGIIGSGNIGANAARLFAGAGHEVALSNSRGGKGLEVLVAELGAKAHATTIADAAKFGEVVLIAIPFGKYQTLPADAFKARLSLTLATTIRNAMENSPNSTKTKPRPAN